MFLVSAMGYLLRDPISSKCYRLFIESRLGTNSLYPILLIKKIQRNSWTLVIKNVVLYIINRKELFFSYG